MNPEWARKIRDDCQAAGVAFFFKGWGEWKPQRVTMGEFRFERVGKKAAAFGSYGWGGESTSQLTAALEEMNVEIVDEPVRVVYSPTDENLQQCYQLGLKISRELASRFG